MQQRIYVVSNALSKIGIYLPFAVVVAFIFERQLLPLVDRLFFNETTVSHFTVLQDQYELLTRKVGSQIDVGSFHLFEIFIWIAPAVSLLRVLTGACSAAVLESSFDKLDKAESRGKSPLAVLFFVWCSHR